MATYQELFDLRQDSDLQNKMTTAIAVKCKAVIDGVGTNGQKDWARVAIINPDASQYIWFVLEANKNSSVAAIQSATDTAVQNNVNNAIDDIIGDLV